MLWSSEIEFTRFSRWFRESNQKGNESSNPNLIYGQAAAAAKRPFGRVMIMSEFQKSLIRYMYVALVLVMIIASWAVLHPSVSVQSAAVGPSGYGGGVTATGSCIVRTKPELVQVTLGVSAIVQDRALREGLCKVTCAKDHKRARSSPGWPRRISRRSIFT